MMPLNHRSMMKVVPMPARQSDSGAKTIVPKLVIQSPAICVPIASTHTP